MPSLYPTFKLPKMALRQRKPAEKTYKQAPMFDYDTGDFVRDGANRIVMANGKEAYMEWCLKQCVTERGTKLAYSDKIGVEIVKATTGASDSDAVQSDIERTIRGGHKPALLIWEESKCGSAGTNSCTRACASRRQSPSRRQGYGRRRGASCSSRWGLA